MITRMMWCDVLCIISCFCNLNSSLCSQCWQPNKRRNDDEAFNYHLFSFVLNTISLLNFWISHRALQFCSLLSSSIFAIQHCSAPQEKKILEKLKPNQPPPKKEMKMCWINRKDRRAKGAFCLSVCLICFGLIFIHCYF